MGAIGKEGTGHDLWVRCCSALDRLDSLKHQERHASLIVSTHTYIHAHIFVHLHGSIGIHDAVLDPWFLCVCAVASIRTETIPGPRPFLDAYARAGSMCVNALVDGGVRPP